jgi:hypothetical protein
MQVRDVRLSKQPKGGNEAIAGLFLILSSSHLTTMHLAVLGAGLLFLGRISALQIQLNDPRTFSHLSLSLSLSLLLVFPASF